MARTNNFRDQHEELLAIANELAKHLDVALLKKDAGLVTKLLSSLAQKLQLHLSPEERRLYPELLKKGNKLIRTTTQHFTNEMETMAKTFFSVYMSKWHNKTAIENEPEAFIEATQVLFDALTTRIRRENQTFYPLLDLMVG
ncbi:MAG: hemerythrin domain-containing protein [Gammaproteobacteria bacterium]|nr:hemerythrin domain-containing protein [Gammaproteobacteria bacterium]